MNDSANKERKGVGCNAFLVFVTVALFAGCGQQSAPVSQAEKQADAPAKTKIIAPNPPPAVPAPPPRDAGTGLAEGCG